MTAPRNRKAYAAGQRAREAIRQTWLALIERQPFRRYTAEQIRRQLPGAFSRLSTRTVQWHMARIQLEADLAELCCDPRNSSTAEPPLS